MLRAFLLAAAVLTSTPLFAQGQPVDAPLTARVSYADLNLADGEGQKAFNARIKRAVIAVCPELNSSITSKLAANHCRRSVSARTQRQMAVVVASAADQRRRAMSTVASR
ncbi:UrcA family protein [Sphingomonas sp. BIUV-7]|uniref:UrcA family protein n=1 Tax=Sphingomonas natans TaxID=3063330 RepID=A0ABT8YCV3_9SPHN|nr:UrcA family protein [Sphingomonas sp. BIUV-7]MDO6416191.1 UrcA family protein [Sphingomonas sp. BIUV-7]